MLKQSLCWCLLLGFSIAAVGQSRQDTSYQIFAGYTRLSNSFNGLPGKEHGLDGWDASVGFPSTHGMRLVLDYVSFNGTNQGAPQKGYFATGGGEYEWHLGQEGIFAEGLLGEAILGENWYNNGGLSTNASFTEFAGGGFDTPLTHSLAFRVEGGVQHTNFALMTSKKVSFPYYRPAGLPDNFARLTAGVVWTHQRSAAAEEELIQEEEDPANHLRESELVFLGESSFGHYKILASDNSTYLQLAGIEYDRHTWGSFLGAQMDYVGAIMPLVVLHEPLHSNAYGNNLDKFLSTSQRAIPGLAITPIGLKMAWLPKRVVSPFLILKGGMIFFTQKALSSVASYEDFTLQETLGVDVRVNRKWAVRVGAGDYHFSNAFVVPSDPGTDVAMWKVGLVYRLGKTKWFR